MPHIKKGYEFLIMVAILTASTLVWFLFRPETYWQRVSTMVFCVLFLAFVGAFIVYYNRFIKGKADVSE